MIDERGLVGQLINQEDGTQVVLLPERLFITGQELDIVKQGDAVLLRPTATPSSSERNPGHSDAA